MSYFNSLGEVRSSTERSLINAQDNPIEGEEKPPVESAYNRTGLYNAFMAKYMPASIKYAG